MRLSKFWSIIVLAGASGTAAACSFDGTELFRPTLERWEQHPGPAQQEEGAEGDYWEKVPQPVVTVTKVTRGTAAPGSSCADAGTIDLEIALPTSSTYSISEFAFYFRVVSGRLPDEIFPDVPLVGRIEDGKAHLLLAWLDGHPEKQIPLDLEVEVFLVTNDLSIGPSAFFEVKADKGG